MILGFKSKRTGRHTPCPYCGTSMKRGRTAPSRDHILPKALERDNTSLNRVIVCRRCNEDKAAMTVIEFHSWLLARDDKRAAHVEAFIEAFRSTAPQAAARYLGSTHAEAS